jgi:diphthine synthase
MLYIIGLGLNIDGISQEGMKMVKKCKRVYLENYTVSFPYSEGELREKLGINKIFLADREFIESEEIVDEAKRLDVALLVYGSPLTATTHISLMNEATRLNVKYKIVYSASVVDAVAGTGLQVYKFGKIASMPKWDEKNNFTPDSFMEIIKENQSINAHSLILIDIGLEFQTALTELKISAEKHNIKLSRIVVCQNLGSKHEKIHYKTIKELEEFTGVREPYCIIIPGKLHFLEKQFLEGFNLF